MTINEFNESVNKEIAARIAYAMETYEERENFLASIHKEIEDKASENADKEIELDNGDYNSSAGKYTGHEYGLGTILTKDEESFFAGCRE